MRITRIMPAVLALSLLTCAVSAQTRVILSGGRGTLDLKLDRTEIAADEAIEGKLIFQLDEVRDKQGVTFDLIRFNGPLLSVSFVDDMAMVPVEVRFRTAVLSTFATGRRYEYSFSIRMDEGFRKLLKKPDETYQLFKTGEFRIGSMLDSPTRPPWEPVPKSQLPELQQIFSSTPVLIKIRAAASSLVVDNDVATRAIQQAEGDVKQKLVMFYAKRGVLTKQDLAKEIEAASGKTKAQLASFWLSMNYPASELKFFTSSGPTLRFTGHDNTPVYVVVRPQQRLHVAFDVATLHHFRAVNVHTPIVTKRQITVDMPDAEGVYEMYDQQNEKPWGWLLVHREPGTNDANLRPDTKELSAKVVAALIARDADALKALGAPNFRPDDALKLTRFKLADGDIRYHESLGTANAVKTRLRINLAPPGKDPVFARELLLEYVRVGDELKLTHANVVDVEK